MKTGTMALERAKRVAARVKAPLQLGFPLEPTIEIAGELFSLDDIGARFWSKVEQTDGCWLWLGAKNPDGYGMMNVRTHRGTSAHRIAYVLKVGLIPTGVSVLHSCDNRAVQCERGENCRRYRVINISSFGSQISAPGGKRVAASH